ncbi:hypothetical protein VC83_09212 [Pseudogymnoascus destructans]|uniref:Conserved oligomeric Golgi complex subunit 5 n=1 Tax=Pseudogymnoascus destructans TaxID=655981 RepID=A0A176ZZ05_9PEZI|nr:uncharacterized protein VC83_09212 [Pseudogymnoascus destructans]OAF54462.1 hypothetical protein VC83_09212 [Pseudogymnoascus destructans]
MATTSNNSAEASDPSYIDYELFLDPSFSAPAFANTLVLTTNNATDSPLDLSTPLSSVPLRHPRTHASEHIVSELSSQAASLNDSYKRLEQEVISRHEAAEEVQRVSERLWHTVRLGRSVGRALQLGRQLEVQMSEQQPRNAQSRDDHRSTVRASNTILSCRALLAANGPGEEGENLEKVHAIAALQRELIAPAERSLHAKAQQVVRDFSMSTLTGSGSTYAQAEDAKGKSIRFEAEWMVQSIQEYLRVALTTSTTSIIRALGVLRTLDDALLLVSSRCQNLVALELLLSSLKAPTLPSLSTPPNFLVPVLAALETNSLTSYFWRSLASALSPRVQELVKAGGMQARTLKSNRNAVRDMVAEAVARGCQVPSGAGKMRDERRMAEWEREVAVMVGAVVGGLGR